MSRADLLRRNILLLQAFQGLGYFLICIPIILPFYQSKGLSLAECFWVITSFSAAVVIFEVPTGYIADVLGRRASLICGSLCYLLGYIGYMASNSLWAFIGCETLLALGVSLKSGSDSALLYDTMAELKQVHRFNSVESTRFGISAGSEAAAAVLGGWLASLSLELPVQIQTLVGLCLFIVSILVVEPERESTVAHPSLSDLFRAARASLVDDRYSRWLLLYGAVVSMATLLMTWSAQLYFKKVGVPLSSYGIVWGLNHLFLCCCSLALGRWAVRANFLVYRSLFFPVALAFFLLGTISALPGILCLWIGYAVRSVSSAFGSTLVNEVAQSTYRATTLSIQSFLMRLIFCVLSPLFGFLATRFGLDTALCTSGAIIAALGAFCARRLSAAYADRLRQTDGSLPRVAA